MLYVGLRNLPLSLFFQWRNKSSPIGLVLVRSLLRKAILKGEKGPKRNAVLLNSAAGLYVSGKVDSLEEGVKMAEELIDSGKALRQLERFIEVTNR